jgi:hypothetical protein
VGNSETIAETKKPGVETPGFFDCRREPADQNFMPTPKVTR